jgi:hypothetical protein
MQSMGLTQPVPESDCVEAEFGYLTDGTLPVPRHIATSR